MPIFSQSMPNLSENVLQILYGRLNKKKTPNFIGIIIFPVLLAIIIKAFRQVFSEGITRICQILHGTNRQWS